MLYLTNFLNFQRKMEINFWPELTANFQPNFESFLQQNLFSDVTLIATDRNGNDVKFPVHRFILASALPYVRLFILQLMCFTCSVFSSKKCLPFEWKKQTLRKFALKVSSKNSIFCHRIYLMNKLGTFKKFDERNLGVVHKLSISTFQGFLTHPSSSLSMARLLSKSNIDDDSFGWPPPI